MNKERKCLQTYNYSVIIYTRAHRKVRNACFEQPVHEVIFPEKRAGSSFRAVMDVYSQVFSIEKKLSIHWSPIEVQTKK